MMLFHGGVAGLNVGDLLLPGHSRDNRHPGCKVCEARAAGTTEIDKPSAHPDRIYLSADLEYARFHASLYGHGDLYRVEPYQESDTGVGLERSEEDLFPSFTAPAGRVLAVLARRVQLTPRQRQKIYIRWAALQGRSKSEALYEFHKMGAQMFSGRARGVAP